jgi:hypothetical protein
MTVVIKVHMRTGMLPDVFVKSIRGRAQVEFSWVVDGVTAELGITGTHEEAMTFAENTLSRHPFVKRVELPGAT